MIGLLDKIWRETRWITALFALAIFAVSALLTYILPQLSEGLDFFDQIPLFRQLVGALLGTQIGDSFTSQLMQALLFVHPVVLVIIWSHSIVICTRVPAGEIDRGTIDILLGLPLSRRTLYLGETIVVMASGAVLLLMAWLGHLAASGAMPPDLRPAGGRVLLVYINLFGVYTAVAGGALLVSAMHDRRGRAVGVIASFIVASFLLNFVAQFYEPVRAIDFLSVLTYYRPARILESGSLNAVDLAVLFGVGAACWTAGRIVFSRRSICTV